MSEKTLEEKQKELEAMVKAGHFKENLSEVAMPGVTILIDNTKKENKE